MRRSITKRMLLAAVGSATLRMMCAGSLAVLMGWATTLPAAAAVERPFEGQTLRVFIYAGAYEQLYKEIFSPPFEAENGVKIVWDVGWNSIPKLMAAPPGRPPYDLVLTSPSGWGAVRQGIFDKIDFANVPNAKKNFHPKVLDTWIYKEGWGLPTLGNTMVLAWNTDKLPGGLKNWSDLFAPNLKGKVTLYKSYYMSLTTFAAAKVSAENRPNEVAKEMETNLDGVLQYAKDHRDWVKHWWPATLNGVKTLLTGEAWAGNMHANGVIPPVKERKPLDFVVPDGDRFNVQLFWGIPKGTKKKKLAEAFLNHFASWDFQWDRVAKQAEFGADIPSVGEKLGPMSRFKIWANLYPSNTKEWDAFKWYPYLIWGPEYRKIVKIWAEEVLRK